MNSDQQMLCSLLRRELSFFLRKGFNEIGGEGTYLHAWYVDALVHVLELVRLGVIRRLIITLPPRHLKSVLASTCWPAWLMGLNPSMRIIAASYGQDLAEKLARDSMRIMETRWYRAAFPALALIRRSVADFETSLGGGRLSTSLNGPITGRGADLIIIDDPIKAADVMSENARKAAIEWLTTVLMSRLNDQETGAIVLVMQRLHQGDLAGQLIEKGGWYELRLPAIAPEDALIPVGNGRVYRRAQGELLHPARQSLETLDTIRAEIGSAAFAAQYLQDPLPAKGNIIQADWLRTYDTKRLDLRRGRVVQSWDTAMKVEDKNDWSVCVTAHVLGRKVTVLDVWRRRVEFTDLWKAVKEQARQWKPATLLIEDAGTGTALIQRLKNEAPSGVPSPLPRRPKLDKISRLEAAGSMIEAGDLLLPQEASWLAAFKAELLGFPSAKHDDQVDALSQLLNWVDLQQRHGSPTIVGPIYC